MVQHDMVLADRLDCLSKDSKELSIEEEYSLLKMEVEHIFVELLLNPKVRRVKMWIYTNWEQCTLTYKVEEDDEKKEKSFRRKYNPNLASQLMFWAAQNELKVQFSTPNEQYERGLLTIEYPNPDRKKHS